MPSNLLAHYVNVNLDENMQKNCLHFARDEEQSEYKQN